MKKKMATAYGNLLMMIAICSSILTIFSGCATDPGEQEKQLVVVVSKGAHQVTFIDRDREEIRESVVTGVAPHQIAVHAEKGLAVVTNYGSVESPGSSLTVIDLHQRRAVRTIALGRFRRPHGIQFFADGRRVLVTSEESRSALVVDVEEAAILRMIPTGRVACRAVVLSPNEQTAYAIAPGENELIIMDMASSQLLETVSLPMPVEGFDVSPDGSELWLVSRAQESLLIVDTESLEPVATLPCPGGPIQIRFLHYGTAAEKIDLAVSLSQAASVAFFSSTERSEQGRLSLGFSSEESEYLSDFELTPVPVGLAEDSLNGLVYVTSSNTDLLSVIDPIKLNVVRRFVVADEPEGIATVDLVLKNDLD